MPSSEDFRCSYSNQPLQFELAKADEDGQAVHEECYVSKHAKGQTTSPEKDGHDHSDRRGECGGD
jgi:hypothetical protein